MVMALHLLTCYFCSDLSTPNMKYLSSEQALEDLANFITSKNIQMALNDAKWIAFGGSYPGIHYLVSKHSDGVAWT